MFIKHLTLWGRGSEPMSQGKQGLNLRNMVKGIRNFALQRIESVNLVTRKTGSESALQGKKDLYLLYKKNGT